MADREQPQEQLPAHRLRAGRLAAGAQLPAQGVGRRDQLRADRVQAQAPAAAQLQAEAPAPERAVRQQVEVQPVAALQGADRVALHTSMWEVRILLPGSVLLWTVAPRQLQARHLHSPEMPLLQTRRETIFSANQATLRTMGARTPIFLTQSPAMAPWLWPAMPSLSQIPLLREQMCSLSTWAG